MTSSGDDRTLSAAFAAATTLAHTNCPGIYKASALLPKTKRQAICAVAAFGRDVRRLRPNIVIGGVDGLDEREWPGAELHIGRAIVRLDSLRGRCPMTTVDPDTLVRDPEVLKDIGRRFGGRLALNAGVLQEGVVAVGDAAILVYRERP